jgi:hypothetical protein
MGKKLAIAFIIVGSLQAWSFSALGTAVRLLHLAAIALMIGIIVINIVYGNGRTIKKNFSLPIWLMIAGTILSMLTAYLCFQTVICHFLICPKGYLFLSVLLYAPFP